MVICGLDVDVLVGDTRRTFETCLEVMNALQMNCERTTSLSRPLSVPRRPPPVSVSHCLDVLKATMISSLACRGGLS